MIVTHIFPADAVISHLVGAILVQDNNGFSVQIHVTDTTLLKESNGTIRCFDTVEVGMNLTHVTFGSDVWLEIKPPPAPNLSMYDELLAPVPVDNPLRTRGASFADKLYPGDSSRRLAFNSGVSWTLKKLYETAIATTGHDILAYTLFHKEENPPEPMQMPDTEFEEVTSLATLVGNKIRVGFKSGRWLSVGPDDYFRGPKLNHDLGFTYSANCLTLGKKLSSYSFDMGKSWIDLKILPIYGSLTTMAPPVIVTEDVEQGDALTYLGKNEQGQDVYTKVIQRL